jgi:uncharacterized membrane protein YfcA
VLIAILLITIFFGVNLFAYNSPKTFLVPAIACGLILVLGAMQLRKELNGDTKKTDSTAASAESKPKKQGKVAAKQSDREYFIGFCWLVGFAIGIYLIGFTYSTFLFLLCFIRFNSKHNWFTSGLIAVLGTAVFWGCFVYLLQSELWGGAIFQWFDLAIPTLTKT